MLTPKQMLFWLGVGMGLALIGEFLAHHLTLTWRW